MNMQHMQINQKDKLSAVDYVGLLKAQAIGITLGTKSQWGRA